MNLQEIILRKFARRKSQLNKYFKRKDVMASVTIKTKHAPWVKFRTISATEAALGNTEKKGANVLNQDYYKIPEAMNNMEVRIACTSASAGKTGTARFYGARYLDKSAGTFDDISLIGSLAITSGEQLSTDNNKYVHQMTLTDRWITEVKVADGDANNGMSRIAFDTSGYDVFFMRIEDGSISGYQWIIDLSGW